jgi:exodeoxyribonuclease VII small subunit
VAKKQQPTFEQALAELEALVERMEAGELPLEESLKQFERGVELTRLCQKSLADAEQKVQIVLEKDGKQILQPFDENDG